MDVVVCVSVKSKKIILEGIHIISFFFHRMIVVINICTVVEKGHARRHCVFSLGGGGGGMMRIEDAESEMVQVQL